MGAPRALALCYNFGGALDFQVGRWPEAEKELRDAVDLYREVGSASGESLSLQRLGVLLTAKGELDEAQRTLDEGLVVAERAAMRSHCLTRLHAAMIRNRLAADDREGIERSLLEGQEAMRRHGNCVTCNALLLPEVVRAQIELGNVPGAREAAEALGQTAAGFGSNVWHAMAQQAGGRVALAAGLFEEAGTAFAAAKEAYLQAEQPYEAARCMAGLAAACRGAGDAARAAELTGAAQAIYADLGAPGIEA